MPEETTEPTPTTAEPLDMQQSLADARQQGLTHLRRALLAEHAGRVVPELIAGDTTEALEASVERARAAFDAARDAALAQLQRERDAALPAVSAGTPSRDGTDARLALPLSPLQRIAAGLRR